jgi:hypothetical protein
LEVRVNRKQLRRLATTLVGASLLVGLAGTVVNAADTRIISIGSTTDCAAAAAHNGDPGTLDVSSGTTVGGLIRVDVSAVNCGGQNLSNATLTIGGVPSAAAQPASALSGGSTFDSFAGACKGAGTATLTCTYKSLRPGVPVSVTAYITAGAVGSLPIYAVIQFNEGTNSTGSNVQTFTASGASTVGRTDCDNFGTYLTLSKRTASIPCAPTDHDNNANGQSTSVKLLGTGQTTAVVRESSDAGDTQTCVPSGGLSCFGDYSFGSVPTAPGDILEWTISVDLTVTGNTNLNTKKVVIDHWYADGTLVQLTNTTADNCKTRAASTGCVVSVTKLNNVLTVIFRTPANGKTRLLG